LFNINEKKRLFLIKQYRCKKIKTYKTNALIGGSVLLVYSNIYGDITCEAIGSILTTGYFAINLGFNYIENYIDQLDQWRQSEAEYEDKTDPPDWNWKIVNNLNHSSIVLNLLSCISTDLTSINKFYFYMGIILQLTAVYIRFKNEKLNKKTLFITGINLSSIALFVLHSSLNWYPLMFMATYISLVSEIIEI